MNYQFLFLNDHTIQNFMESTNPTNFVSNRKKINEDYAKISSILSKRSFSYEDPMTLQYPFKKVTSNNTEYVDCFIYYLDFYEREFALCILASKPWGKLNDIKILKSVKKVIGSEDLIEDYERIKVNLPERHQIPINIFEKLFKFYTNIFADFYLIAKKNIETSFNSFEELFFESSIKKFFLIVPAKKLSKNYEIDFEFMNNFLNFKDEKNNENLPKLIDQIKKYGNDTENLELQKYLSESLFSSIYSNRTNYYILDIIMRPHEEKAIKYLELLLKYFHNKKNIDDLLTLFSLTKEQAETITINDLLYEHELKENVDSIYHFRNLDSKYNLQTNKDLPIAILNYLNHMNCFDFQNPKSSINCINSVKKLHYELISPNVHLLPIQYLIEYPLSCELYNLFCRIPSIFIQLERYIQANEMMQFLKIKANTIDLIQATTSPSYDITNNFEVLEVVGDSVLKFIASGFLFKRFPNQNEDFLTQTRSQYIKNKYLSKIAYQNFFHFFLKTHKKNVNQWRTPLVKDSFGFKCPSINHTIAAKNLADTFEAVLGVLFIYGYELNNVIKGLTNMDVPITYNLLNCSMMSCESKFIIPSDYFYLINSVINENMNYYELKKTIENKNNFASFSKKNFIKSKIKSLNLKNKILNSSNRKFCGSAFKQIFRIFDKLPFHYNFLRNSKLLKALEKLETKILKYSFKNKNLLITALNFEAKNNDPLFRSDYQSLEFLGDALLEVFVVGNAYKIFADNKIAMVPEIMQRLKITLLSNSFMARMITLLGVYKYIFNVNEETENEINKFIKKIKFNRGFKTFVRHETYIPKALSDIWESLSAAVLMDGGWDAFLQVFGSILAPYLKFFCKYYKRIETNIISKLKNDSQEKFQKLIDFKMEYKDDEKLFINSVFLGNELVCQAKGKSNKIARERAGMKACKILQLL